MVQRRRKDYDPIYRNVDDEILEDTHDPVSITASSDGTGTGTIPDGSRFVNVTCTHPDYIVILPSAITGSEVVMYRNNWEAVLTAGFELRSSSPSTIRINGGSGSSVESAIASNCYMVKCYCISTADWLCEGYSQSVGTSFPIEAAA